MAAATSGTPPEDAAAPGQRLLRTWRSLSGLPGGRWLFARALGRMVPYTGALGARVEALEPGYARVRLRERRGVRNHLSSVHAVALVNLGELTTGLALLTALPVDRRGIVVRLEAAYYKKARGLLVAEARASVLPAEGAVSVAAAVVDEEGERVAVITAHWRVGPRAPQP